MAHGSQKQGLGLIGPVRQLPGTFEGDFNLLACADITERANQYVLTFVARGRKRQVQKAAILHFDLIAVAQVTFIERARNPAMT